MSDISDTLNGHINNLSTDAKHLTDKEKSFFDLSLASVMSLAASTVTDYAIPIVKKDSLEVDSDNPLSVLPSLTKDQRAWIIDTDSRYKGSLGVFYDSQEQWGEQGLSLLPSFMPTIVPTRVKINCTDDKAFKGIILVASQSSAVTEITIPTNIDSNLAGTYLVVSAPAWPISSSNNNSYAFIGVSNSSGSDIGYPSYTARFFEVYSDLETSFTNNNITASINTAYVVNLTLSTIASTIGTASSCVTYSDKVEEATLNLGSSDAEFATGTSFTAIILTFVNDVSLYRISETSGLSYPVLTYNTVAPLECLGMSYQEATNRLVVAPLAFKKQIVTSTDIGSATAKSIGFYNNNPNTVLAKLRLNSDNTSFLETFSDGSNEGSLYLASKSLSFLTTTALATSTNYSNTVSSNYVTTAASSIFSAGDSYTSNDVAYFPHFDVQSYGGISNYCLANLNSSISYGLPIGDSGVKNVQPIFSSLNENNLTNLLSISYFPTAYRFNSSQLPLFANKCISFDVGDNLRVVLGTSVSDINTSNDSAPILFVSRESSYSSTNTSGSNLFKISSMTTSGVNTTIANQYLTYSGTPKLELSAIAYRPPTSGYGSEIASTAKLTLDSSGDTNNLPLWAQIDTFGGIDASGVKYYNANYSSNYRTKQACYFSLSDGYISALFTDNLFTTCLTTSMSLNNSREGIMVDTKPSSLFLIDSQNSTSLLCNTIDTSGSLKSGYVFNGVDNNLTEKLCFVCNDLHTMMMEDSTDGSLNGVQKKISFFGISYALTNLPLSDNNDTSTNINARYCPSNTQGYSNYAVNRATMLLSESTSSAYKLIPSLILAGNTYAAICPTVKNDVSTSKTNLYSYITLGSKVKLVTDSINGTYLPRLILSTKYDSSYSESSSSATNKSFSEGTGLLLIGGNNSIGREISTTNVNHSCIRYDTSSYSETIAMDELGDIAINSIFFGWTGDQSLSSGLSSNYGSITPISDPINNYDNNLALNSYNNQLFSQSVNFLPSLVDNSGSLSVNSNKYGGLKLTSSGISLNSGIICDSLSFINSTASPSYTQVSTTISAINNYLNGSSILFGNNAFIEQATSKPCFSENELAELSDNYNNTATSKTFAYANFTPIIASSGKFSSLNFGLNCCYYNGEDLRHETALELMYYDSFLEDGLTPISTGKYDSDNTRVFSLLPGYGIVYSSSSGTDHSLINKTVNIGAPNHVFHNAYLDNLFTRQIGAASSTKSVIDAYIDTLHSDTIYTNSITPVAVNTFAKSPTPISTLAIGLEYGGIGLQSYNVSGKFVYATQLSKQTDDDLVNAVSKLGTKFNKIIDHDIELTTTTTTIASREFAAGSVGNYYLDTSLFTISKKIYISKLTAFGIKAATYSGFSDDNPSSFTIYWRIIPNETATTAILERKNILRDTMYEKSNSTSIVAYQPYKSLYYVNDDTALGALANIPTSGSLIIQVGITATLVSSSTEVTIPLVSIEELSLDYEYSV